MEIIRFLSSPFNSLSEKQNYLLYGATGGQVDENEMKLTGARDGVFLANLRQLTL